PRIGALAVFRSVQEKLHAVEILLAEHRIGAKLRGAGVAGAADSAILHLIGNMEVAAAIVMRSVFLLGFRDELSKRLTLFGHHVRQEQRIEHTVALGKKASIANPSRLLSSDQNFVGHHYVGSVFKADGDFV